MAHFSLRARARLLGTGIAALAALWAGPVSAGAFRIAPVSVEVRPGAAASALTVQNLSSLPMTIQLRVFRWRQAAGAESLDPTDQVVVSPPIATIAPGQSHVVRIARLAGGEIATEEAYRLWADEVPDPRNAHPGEVTLLLRQSIPVFFEARLAALPALHASLGGNARGAQLIVGNAGSRRERISDLRVTGADGTVLLSRAGLLGYVLANAEMRWAVPLPERVSWPITISATSEHGPIHFVSPAPGAH